MIFEKISHCLRLVNSFNKFLHQQPENHSATVVIAGELTTESTCHISNGYGASSMLRISSIGVPFFHRELPPLKNKSDFQPEPLNACHYV